MIRRRGVLGVLVLVALGVAACGYDPPTDVVVPTGDDRAPTSTTMPPPPPGGRQPTEEDPLRVLLAGDSVMADLAPAVIDGLDRGGAADARFFLSPGVSLSAAAEVLWKQQLDSFDPEVVVVLVGTWETAGDLGTPGAPGWREAYDTRILDPFASLVTSEGAQLLWVGMPAVVDPASTFELAELNAAYSALADRSDAVAYLPGGEFVSSPEGGYAEFVTNGDGTVERLRRTDGLHLCPGGATRLAEPVLDRIVEQWNVPVAEDWRAGSWREPPELVKPEECPAP